MGVLLALGSAFFYGLADFIGGLLSRRADPTTVALVGQVGALVLTVLAAPFVPATGVTMVDLAWGGLSGIGTGVGMVFLYRGLSRGSMSVVVPLVAVGGTLLPVLIAVSILGDRPTAVAWIGIIAALPSLWLISTTSKGAVKARADGAADALISSVGIAVQYTALAQVADGVGLWPIVAGRVTAVLVVLPMARRTGTGLRTLPVSVSLAAVATGGMAALGLTLYMLATREQLMTIAVVLSSLYPVLPVLLGITVLRERLTARRSLGLAGAAVAVVLITLG
ncbi:DMT family transporter [Georgenia subflava]|uniref:EamA family transporter n=1 Tax=Georgenia subflava TaxID=1622177 RepID=A0A6N7EF22_9MICO|nr:DMT family transporter [Georgenia subflava]MPV36620.1 EamA family transporter [Georgenia subflava]